MSRTAQRWFASFTVEVERNVPLHHSRPGTAIGVDLGVKTLLTGVDGEGNVVTVAGMVRNRALARAIADQGFGIARRLLDYKTTWHGGRLVRVL